MKKNRKNPDSAKTGFTLVELLVVISIIALLMAILMPVLSGARTQGKAVVCQSNVRQLVLASIGYANENGGYYVPAASDIYETDGGLHRWHGVRENTAQPFDPLKGPLIGYLRHGAVKECTEKVKFVKGQSWGTNYEQGSGGYGYNQTYIGSRLREGWRNENYEKTTRITEVVKTSATIMFADSAMANKDSGGRTYIHEYSFVQQPFFLNGGMPEPDWGYASPSIHFRHRKKANIAWVDGHISSENITKFEGVNGYGVKSFDMMIGWFGPLNNHLFDLK